MENVTKDVCDERCKKYDERFARDKSDINKLTDNQEKIETLTIQMGEILKNHTAMLEDHNERISAIEKRPSAFWDKLIFTIIGVLGTIAINGFLK